MIALHEPTGTSRLAAFLRAVVRGIKECRLLDGVGYKVERTQYGSLLKLSPTSFSQGTPLKMSYLQSVEDDYLICNEEVGGGGNDVLVAKMPRLRCSASNDETVFGQTWYYGYEQDGTYPLVWYRTVSDPGLAVWVEVIVPAYIQDEVIISANIKNTGVTVDTVPLEHVELLPNRFWAG